MKKSIKQKKIEKKISRQRKKAKWQEYAKVVSKDTDYFAKKQYKEYLRLYKNDLKSGISRKDKKPFSQNEFLKNFNSYIKDPSLDEKYSEVKTSPSTFFADRGRQQTKYQIANVMKNYTRKLEAKPEVVKKAMEADPITANVLEMSDYELEQRLLTDDAFASAFYRALQSKEFKETVYNEETGEYEEIEGFHAYADDGSPI